MRDANSHFRFYDDKPPHDFTPPNLVELSTQSHAQVEVEAATGDSSGTGSGGGVCTSESPMLDFAPRPLPSSTSSSSFVSPSQSLSRSGIGSNQSSNSTTTPTRTRQFPPSSIPNFPGPSEPRNPSPIIPFSPSPTSSPAQPSSFRFPLATIPNRPQGILPISNPQPTLAGAGPTPLSPWLHLAATSGAPTPSIDGPSRMGSRGSPQLGYPFEQLNIGGSWSGANLELRRSSVDKSIDPSRLDLDASIPRGAISCGPGSSKSPPNLARRRPSIPNTANVGLAIKSPSKLSSSSTVAPSGKIEPLLPSSLAPLVRQPTVLILDVRPPSAFNISHVATAHSLPIPSTLLRRPTFTLKKLLQMLDISSQKAISSWQEKSDIVLIDQDASAIGDGSVLQGLASKFEREGFKGKMWFVKGGQLAVTADGKCEISQGAVSDVETPGSSGPLEETRSMDSMTIGIGRLGRLAFQQGSTSMSFSPGLASRPDPLSMPITSVTERPTSLHLEAGVQEKIQFANPFFDNIRQNLELAHGGITERIPLALPQSTIDRASELPRFLRALVEMPEKESMDKLADQFYKIELGEQKRLQSVMEWHSKSSSVILHEAAGKGFNAHSNGAQAEIDAEEKRKMNAWGEGEGHAPYFPFSISAGVEKGAKNRYNNIWPYDFSRVRLTASTDDQSDYINASYIQPRGTSRRYIATQGPLDATYGDFWSLVWEQGVSVIVMLTKQLEGGLIKCGNYWGNKKYGPIALEVISQTGGDDHVEQASGFDFGLSSRVAPTEPISNIKRIFHLRHEDFPDVPARRIVQIQCVTWPDFDVPETPDMLLQLIKDVDAAMLEDGVQSDDNRLEQPPVLVHCSAGVGRTGSFILVDALLDGLRRERQGLTKSHKSEITSDVPPPQASSSSSRFSFPGMTSSTSVGSKSDSLSSIGDLPTKNVSFLNSQTAATSFSSLPTMFSTSPAVFATPVHSPLNISSLAAGPGPVSTSGSRSGSGMVEAEQTGNGEGGEPLPVGSMEIETSQPNPAFTRHRGSIVSLDSEPEPRRPSLASVYTSSERLSSDSGFSRGIDNPRPVTRSDMRHRTPSPLSEMEEPVAEVLEGMRVQRMSLVQSLRQYLFVHRAIIHHYLAMLDEEAGSTRSTNDDPPTSSCASTAPLTVQSSTAATSAVNTDDEGHIKRKPSPTELHPEIPLPGAREQASLAKRPSFKKMRPTGGLGAVLGTNGSPGTVGSGSSATTTSTTSTAKSISSSGSETTGLGPKSGSLAESLKANSADD